MRKVGLPHNKMLTEMLTLGSAALEWRTFFGHLVPLVIIGDRYFWISSSSNYNWSWTFRGISGLSIQLHKTHSYAACLKPGCDVTVPFLAIHCLFPPCSLAAGSNLQGLMLDQTGSISREEMCTRNTALISIGKLSNILRKDWWKCKVPCYCLCPFNVCAEQTLNSLRKLLIDSALDPKTTEVNMTWPQ